MTFQMKLKTIYRESIFNNSFMGFVVNPAYIARSALFKIFRQKSPLFNGLKVLDVGCGSKPYKDLFKGVKTYTGVDTNFSGHDHKNEEIDVYYDGKILPFPDNSFDAVFSFQVLEHVEDEVLFLSELHRVLVSKGVVMLSFPFCGCEHEQPFDFRRLTTFGAIKVLEKNDFEVTELIKTTNSLQTVLQLFNTYLSMNLKTRFGLLNIVLICIYSPVLNLLGYFAGKISNDSDLFCDLVVLARKKTSLANLD